MSTKQSQGTKKNEAEAAEKAVGRAMSALDVVKKDDPKKTVNMVTSKVADMSPEKKKALSDALAGIEKEFGKGSIMKMGERPQEKIPVVSTGSLAIDMALGIGGFAKGRIIEIYGPESSGKTTIALQTIAQSQKKGGVCAYVDAEHALDPSYARALGVNVDEMLLSQPDCGEQALEITERLVRSGAIDVLVVDSVAALVPRAEIEGEMGDSHMGLQARLMSQALRKLTAAINRTNTTVIFINQLRMKIGVMFGNPETTTGGNALKFYASVRMDVRRGKKIGTEDLTIGATTTVKIIKNKFAPPFKNVEVEMIYGKGIDPFADLIKLGVTAGYVEKSGAWFSLNGERMGQGMEQAKEYLRQNPQAADKLREDILAASEKVSEGLEKKTESVDEETGEVTEN